MGTLLLLGALTAAQAPATLRTQISALNLPLPHDADDLDTPTTSGKIFRDARAVVFAYYEAAADGRLHALHVRAFDKRARTWRSVVYPQPIGSVVDIRHGGGVFYIVGHESPSGGPLLVLTDKLARRGTLDGWPMLVLKDGRLVFNRGMRHFAPTHAEVLAIYDPKHNSERTLFPRGAENERGAEQNDDNLWIDRSFGRVRSTDGGRAIEFVATTTLNRVDASNTAHRVGEPTRRHVVCDVSRPSLACRVSPVD
jgi:hypothetical protein